MVVMNLPRDERFKPENLLVVGIIPGPKEPKHHINSFLQPLVDDLIDLWDGVILAYEMVVRRCLELRFWPCRVIYHQHGNVVVLLVIMPR